MDFYFKYRAIILVGAVVLPAAFCLVHYIVVGPKGKALASLPRTLERFSIWDRVIHAIRVLAFVAVAITGYVMAFGPDAPRVGHMVWGGIFLAGAIIAILLWNRHSLPSREDGEWLARLGGYLSKKPIHLRSGKFNAGQKGFMWLTLAFAAALTITGLWMAATDSQTATFRIWLAIHGILAALTVLMIVAHIYLSLFAVPGTWPVLFRGLVSREWLAHHHPDDPSLKTALTPADTSNEDTRD